MLKIGLSKNIQKSKFHDLTHAWGDGVVGGCKNEEILKSVPSKLLKSLTYDNEYGTLVFTANIEK